MLKALLFYVPLCLLIGLSYEVHHHATDKKKQSNLLNMSLIKVYMLCVLLIFLV